MENPIKMDDLGVPLFSETSSLMCVEDARPGSNWSTHIATLPISFFSVLKHQFPPQMCGQEHEDYIVVRIPGTFKKEFAVGFLQRT